MQYLGRALKRRSNRRHFESLPMLLQKSILAAKEETGNRMPARRAIRKQIKLAKSKRDKRQEQMRKEVSKMILKAKKNLKAERAEKRAKIIKQKRDRRAANAAKK